MKNLNSIIIFCFLFVLTGGALMGGAMVYAQQNTPTPTPEAAATDKTQAETGQSGQPESSTTQPVEEILPEGALSLKELPPYILLIAQRAVPDAQYNSFIWELGDTGKPIYRLAGTTGEEKIEIDVFLDGSVEKIQRNTVMSNVPTNVVGMLDKYVVDFKVESVTVLTLAGGLTRYKFDGKLAGVSLNVEVDSNASEIKITEMP